MSCARYVAALAVLVPVPVPALLWTPGCVIQSLSALSRVVTRWGVGSARREGGW